MPAHRSPTLPGRGQSADRGSTLVAFAPYERRVPMRGVAFLSPVADMPLAFLVERIGVACVADLWRIELQCDLPCKPSRRYPDAPLAHLIGMQAKQD